jgi:hypothetical protein
MRKLSPRALRSTMMVAAALVGMGLGVLAMPAQATATWCYICGGTDCHATTLDRSCECITTDGQGNCFLCQSSWGCLL